MAFNDKNLLFNIIINTDIEDIYKLYETNKFIKAMLNEKYTLLAIAEKYNLHGDDFIDILYDYYVNKINTLTNFRYKNLNVSKALKIKLLCYYEHVIPSDEEPQTAYIIFAKQYLDVLRDQYPELKNVQLMTEIGKKWRAMDEKDRLLYKEYELRDIFRYIKNKI